MIGEWVKKGRLGLFTDIRHVSYIYGLFDDVWIGGAIHFLKSGCGLPLVSFPDPNPREKGSGDNATVSSTL